MAFEEKTLFNIFQPKWFNKANELCKALALIDFVWREQYKRFILTPRKEFDRVSGPILDWI